MNCLPGIRLNAPKGRVWRNYSASEPKTCYLPILRKSIPNWKRMGIWSGSVSNVFIEIANSGFPQRMNSRTLFIDIKWEKKFSQTNRLVNGLSGLLALFGERLEIQIMSIVGNGHPSLKGLRVRWLI